MAIAMGREEIGKGLIADMREQKRQLTWNGAPIATAITLQANRGTAGKGSLMDELLRVAGFRNLAAELGIPAYGRIALEEVLVNQPGLLVLDGAANANPARATEFVDHHALLALAGKTRLVSLPIRVFDLRRAGEFRGDPLARGGAAVNRWLILLVVALYLLSLAVGPAWWPWRLGNEVGWAIVWELRVPRATLGLLIGGVLGLSGAVLQGWLRNPLAEPGVIGVSACAGFAAVCAFYSGLAAAFVLALPLAGIAGAGIAVALLMGAVRSGTGTVSLLLMGVAINAIAAALISLVLAMSPNPFAYQEISLWLAGSIVDRDLRYLAIAAPFMIAGAAIVLGAGRWLDALSLGEDTARSLGVDTKSLGLRLTLGVGLMVGAATSVAGIIGFVGLIAPHVVRARVDFRPGATLVPSMLVGAALVLIADIAVRLLPTAYELQLGVFTSLVGAPFLVRAVRKARSAWLAA